MYDKEHDVWSGSKRNKRYYARRLPMEVIRLLKPAIKPLIIDDEFLVMPWESKQSHYMFAPLVPAYESINETYELVNYIAKGGYGFVWEGRHRESGEAVAIKFLCEDQPRAQDIANQETLGKAGVSVPFIEMKQGDDWTIIVMGLGREVAPSEWTDAYVQEALARIRAMYELGIRCTDLKPSNTVMYHNEIRLIDFDALCEETQFISNIKLIVNAYKKKWPLWIMNGYLSRYTTTRRDVSGQLMMKQKFTVNQAALEQAYPGVPGELLTMCVIFLGNLGWYNFATSEAALRAFAAAYRAPPAPSAPQAPSAPSAPPLRF